MAQFTITKTSKKVPIRAVLASDRRGLFLKVRGGGVMYLCPLTLELVESECFFSLESALKSCSDREPVIDGEIITIEL